MAGFYIHKSNNTIFASTCVGGEFFHVNAKELCSEDISWTLGGSFFQKEIPILRDKIDLEEVSFSFSKEIEPSISFLDPFLKANKTSGISLRHCPVYKLGHPFDEWLKSKLESAKKFHDDLLIEDFELGIKVLNSRRRILDSMDSFLYCNEELKIDWSIFSQKAGRLSIQSGFNPMVLKKTERHKVKSKEPNRHIVYCDFKALEFRIALKSLGCKEYEDLEDPYKSIAEDVELNCKDRSVYKNAMIALLYGSSLKYSKLQDEDKLALINWFSENMNTSLLVEEAMEDVDSFGYIRSIFGRRIYQDENVTSSMIINNIFQASGADFVFISYAKLLDYISKHSIDAKPIFMIHDSIVFDVSDSAISKLSEIQRVNGYPIEWGSFAE